MSMSVYKTLDENEYWRAVVCASPAEARELLGARPDVMLGRVLASAVEYAPLWAAPGKLFTMAFAAYPRVWEPILNSAEGSGAC